jgi:hypothetical protein
MGVYKKLLEAIQVEHDTGHRELIRGTKAKRDFGPEAAGAKLG